jgi:hypothetical protein
MPYGAGLVDGLLYQCNSPVRQRDNMEINPLKICIESGKEAVELRKRVVGMGSN